MLPSQILCKDICSLLISRNIEKFDLFFLDAFTDIMFWRLWHCSGCYQQGWAKSSRCSWLVCFLLLYLWRTPWSIISWWDIPLVETVPSWCCAWPRKHNSSRPNHLYSTSRSSLLCLSSWPTHSILSPTHQCKRQRWWGWSVTSSCDFCSQSFQGPRLQQTSNSTSHPAICSCPSTT